MITSKIVLAMRETFFALQLQKPLCLILIFFRMSDDGPFFFPHERKKVVGFSSVKNGVTSNGVLIK